MPLDTWLPRHIDGAFNHSSSALPDRYSTADYDTEDQIPPKRPRAAGYNDGEPLTNEEMQNMQMTPEDNLVVSEATVMINARLPQSGSDDHASSRLNPP